MTTPTNTPPVASPQATEEQSDQALYLALKQIPGLDIEFGLKVVRGRMSSYKRLLGKLIESHADDFALIEQQLAEGHTDEARRLAHSLKGATGSLGIVGIQQSAATLELMIRDMAANDKILEQCQQTAALYRDFESKLCVLLAPAQAPTPPILRLTQEELHKLLTQLQNLLSACDMEVQPLVRRQQENLSPLLGVQLPVFSKHVANFEFEEALDLLRNSIDAFPGLGHTAKTTD